MKLEFDLNDELFRDMIVRHVTATLREHISRWSALPDVASKIAYRCDALVDDAVQELLNDSDFLTSVVQDHVTRKIRARVDETVRKATKATDAARARNDALLTIAAESLVGQRYEEQP